MADYDAGEFFSDDGIDAATAAELESNAIQFTQHLTQGGRTSEPPSSDYGDDDFEDEDLDDAVVYDESRRISETFHPLQQHATHVVRRREQLQQARCKGATNINAVSSRSLTPNWTSQSQSASHGAREIPNAMSFPARRNVNAASTTANPASDVEALQKQIQDLLRQQEVLKQNLNARSGEIAIVRSKHEKTAKEYERELTTIKKLNAERVANLQKTVESARESEKVAATELEFVKRDLFEEAQKVKHIKRSKSKETPVNDLVTTPKRRKSAGHGDGFDDDEIQIISPSNIQGRKSNGGTPTKAGAKRKRKGADSPKVPLNIVQDEELLPQPNVSILDEILLERLKRPDDRLEFLETLLDHRPGPSQLKIVEEFAKFSFASSAGESFVSIVFGKLPKISSKSSAGDFAIEVCEIFISLWSQCLTEKFNIKYEPIPLFISLLMLALELKTLAIAPYIIDSLLPVAQETGEIVGIRRFKRESCSQFEKDIDVSACLALIHLAALGCMHDKEHNIRFWRLMRLDFVLMILSQHQPVKDFDMMLQLLSMSTMRDSIGPKLMDQDKQYDQAKYIIDRVSLLLVSLPTLEKGATKHDVAIISNLRLQILRTFDAFCQTPWGGEVLALHRYAVGRLVKLMSDELDAMYDHRSRHKQSARLVCLTIRILYYLVTKHDESLKIQEKLSMIHGGAQKYLICLARINFAEGELVLDADIDPEVSECAHEMLELAVTPEEGDAIHSAFLAA
ncbi:MAG: hypothetical protein M1818_004294 [Claussenomyces sp. TS43310]|nr:MAG: hypothetical protein M1818_004294 [Claussenomyces sp. TS43310]